MPRISDRLIDCSVYLYPSIEAARMGERGGGSGFLVAVPSLGRGHYVYVVTAKHVIDNGALVLRLNTSDGKMDTLTTSYDSWFVHPDGDDVAVLPITLTDDFSWFCVSTRLFITPDIIRDWHIGLGDETFMVGRLVNRDGIQRNAPVVRFGNLSFMADPDEPVERADGFKQESFLVESRSLGGFSGSPVFVISTQGYEDHNLPSPLKQEREEFRRANPNAAILRHPVTTGVWGPWLLGLDWGHPPLWDKVFESDLRTVTDYRTKANTGIAYVVPAWRIMDVLNMEDLVAQRKRSDDQARLEAEREKVAISDSDSTEMEEGPIAFDRFKRAVTKVISVPKTALPPRPHRSKTPKT
jgi:hypothetical protein